MIKDLVKSFFASSGIWMLYDVLEHKKVKKDLKYSGLKSISDFDKKSRKSSDTIFILGSGYSINNLTAKDWDLIESHDSFGFNSWMFHKHIPTYYGWEISFKKTYYDAQNRALASKQGAYKNVPVFMQYQHAVNRSFSLEDIAVSEDNLYYFTPFFPHTTNRSLLKKMVRKKLNSKTKELNEVVNYSGSLSYIIMMCYYLGYKEIVLLGIDLNDPRYWFMRDYDLDEHAQGFKKVHLDYYKERVGADSMQKKHATVEKAFTKKFGSLPIDEYIAILKKELEVKGVSLKIGHKGSKLYPMLPLYEF